MKPKRLYLVTGAMLIITPLLFNIFFTLLQMSFEYPTILRQPTDYILTKFVQGGSGLIAQWYGLVFAALLIIPLALLVGKLLEGEDTPYIGLTTALGVLAGLVQVLGLARWPFLVPNLSATYSDAGSSEAAREAAGVVFQAFQQYAGIAVGEHLGYLFTGAWTIMVGLTMVNSKVFKSWLGWAALVPGLAIMLGVLAPLGIEIAATINTFGYILWSLCLIVAGVFVLRAQPETSAVPAAVRLRVKAEQV